METAKSEPTAVPANQGYEYPQLQPARSTFISVNEPVSSESNFDRPRPTSSNRAGVRMVVCALDYRMLGQPLTCTVDSKNVQRLCRFCSVTDLTVMHNEECTVENVKASIMDV